MSRLSMSVLGAAALLAGAAPASIAQGHGHGAHPAPAHAPDMRGMKPPKPDHDSPMGPVREDARRSEKRQDDVAGRAEKRQDEVAGRAVNRQDRMARNAAQIEHRAEHAALRDAHDQSRYLLRGVKLSGTERRQVRDIDKRYETQLRALRKDEKVADKAGTDNDAAYGQRIAALAAQERAEIRAVLSPAEQARFDANASARGSMKH